MLFSRARSAERDGGGCHCLASGRLPGNVTGCTHRRSLLYSGNSAFNQTRQNHVPRTFLPHGPKSPGIFATDSPSK